MENMKNTVYTDAEKNVETLCYDDFGALGDGVTDDYVAIDRTHVKANENGKKVIAVGENALKSSDLTSLTLEEGVERLDYQSVRDSISLTEIHLPKSLKLIGNYAVHETDSLRVIYYAGTEEDWKKIEIGVNGNKPLKSVTIEYGK